MVVYKWTTFDISGCTCENCTMSKTRAETAMRGDLERPGQCRQLDLVWFITNLLNFGFVLG
jgi:hypothetical protein